MAEDKAEILKHGIEKAHRKFKEGLEADLDIELDRLEALGESVRSGMEEGRAKFIPPSKKGSLGVLRYQSDTGMQEREITDTSEAAYFQALQEDVDSKKT